jgi:GT2 family glycosyltransferase
MASGVACIVLTFNNVADTRECLSSLKAASPPPARIFVVDNGSTDGSLAALEREWGETATFVPLPQNLGVAAGWNHGIRAAMAENFERFLILNNDTVVEPGILSALVEALDRSPASTGLVSPVILKYDEPETVWYAGGRYGRLLGITRHPFLGKKWSDVRGAVTAASITDYAPICAVLMTRQAYERVGPFDEGFFFGHEDIDWCLRAADAGLRCVLVGQALVRHKISVTGGRRGGAFSNFSAFHFGRGSMRVGHKHHRGWRIAPFLFGQFCVRLPAYTLQILASRQVAPAALYAWGMVLGLSDWSRLQ